ncbi:hypothetical protein [Hydrogenophaga defluvii]|uniref:Uncharacterized protein n=1 Tax=Hydrogenophaga defluvii TaxID=249410 RepID=A0ABW2SF85_9BURK
MDTNTPKFPVDAAARRQVASVFAIALLMATMCIAFWVAWPEQTNWVIRMAGVGMLVMAVLLGVVWASPSLHEKLNKL